MRSHETSPCLARSRVRRGPAAAWLATLLACGLAGCLGISEGWPQPENTGTDTDTDTGTSDTDGAPGYRATVRWTSDGVAHVLAESYRDAGFGLGYAFARDHACTLADQVVKVRSERARYHGPGYNDANINSDFGHKAIDLDARAEAAWTGLPAETQGAIEGYAAGYNHYLDEVGPAGITGWCSGAEWLTPITAKDLVAYHLTLGMVASSTQLIEFIATATPPGSADAIPGPPLRELGAARRSGLGSNGWAIGKDKSASGRGMVLANPHFPWQGELRLWESHVTIPGALNIYGVSLMGVPAINIGFNEGVAWTHTFSLGQRMTIYTLDLVPGEPTRYYHGDETREMTSREFTISVRKDDGSLAERTRTLYFSHYGPIINALGFGWNESLAITYRDANLGNDKLIAQFLEMNRATDLAAFQQVFEDVKGMPWAHTMATDAEGNTWYVDAAATPNLRPEAVDGWIASLEQAGLPRAVYEQAGAMVLDGSDPVNEWVEVPGAREPGLVPFAAQPQLSRSDYVMNANDSHWLANASAPITGHLATHGFERAPQSIRTRTNLDILTGPAFAGADGKFTMEEVQEAVFGNTSIAVGLLQDDVAARCEAWAMTEGSVPLDGDKVELGDACTILKSWDGRADLDSAGAVLWREFMGSYTDAQREDAGPLFSVGFDPDDPIATPHTLPPPPVDSEDNVLRHVALAIITLQEAGIPLDATLRDTQYAELNGVRYPIHGAAHAEGVMNQVFHSILQTSLEPYADRGEVINATTDLTDDGYLVNYGSSSVMVTEFTDSGPRARTVLTYGQTEDPASPATAAAVEAFAAKQWRAVRFTEEDIAADPGLVTLELEGDASAP